VFAACERGGEVSAALTVEGDGSWRTQARETKRKGNFTCPIRPFSAPPKFNHQ